MMICFLHPSWPKTRSAPGGAAINYGDNNGTVDDDDDDDDEDDDDDDNNDDDLFHKKKICTILLVEASLEWNRICIASVPLIHGMENVCLQAIKLVLNVSMLQTRLSSNPGKRYWRVKEV